MKGHVDGYGRALITVSVRLSDVAATHDVQVWIDTGFMANWFTETTIDDLGLRQSGTVKAILADGSEVALRRYFCLIEWFGEQCDLEVIANDGEYPLLGVGLLLGHDLHVSYRTGEITID